MFTFNESKAIFIASFVAFIILNTIENLIHYSIGRSYEKNLQFNFPTKTDWIRIIITMIIFAVLQALSTILFVKLEKKL